MAMEITADAAGGVRLDDPEMRAADNKAAAALRLDAADLAELTTS